MTTRDMSIQEELYRELSEYHIDNPLSPPPANHSHQNYIKERISINLIESVISFETQGFWEKDEYRWVSLADIEEKEIWKPASLKFCETQIMSQKPLHPIRLYLPKAPSDKYTIIDGIHRIHALKKKGSTHVLALITNVKVHQMPEIPPEAMPFLEAFKKKFLSYEVASELSGMVNRGNVYIILSQSFHSNDLTFSLLREGVDLSNVEQLPPDCQLKVLILDNDSEMKEVQVTGTIFGYRVECKGSKKEVVEFIQSKLSTQLLHPLV